MAETNKTMVMKFGKLYDSETNKYQVKALRAGQPLFSRLEQKDGMYQKPSIYGFETTEGDTAYYTGTSKSRSMSMLDAKGTSRFLSNVLQNFDETHMDKSGFKKFFKKGKTPRKAGDKPKMGSKVFNFLKKAR